MTSIYDVETDKVTRFEVIDNHGRSYTKYGVIKLHFSLQDDDRTLKIFVDHTDNEEQAIHDFYQFDL